MEPQAPVRVVPIQTATNVGETISVVINAKGIGGNQMGDVLGARILNVGTVTPTTDTATHALKDMGSTEQIINLVCHVSTRTVNFAPTTCINALPARMAGEKWVTLVPDATHGA